MPGIGLWLLRTALGSAAVVQGIAYLAGHGEITLVKWTGGVLAVFCGALLLAGFLTPVAAVTFSLGVLSAALSWIPSPAASLAEAKPTMFFVMAVALAVLFLGPGAFSVDARLFGRREIVIPPASRQDKR